MNGTETGDPNMTLMLMGVGASVVFTLIWLVVVAITTIRFIEASKGGVSAQKGAMILWLVTLAGVFTGPFVVIFGLAGVVGGLRNMLRSDVDPATRAAGVATLAHSSIMLVIVAVLVLSYVAAVI